MNSYWVAHDLLLIQHQTYTYFQIVPQRTQTMHQQRVGSSESRGYWKCCWGMALAFVLETDNLKF